MRMVKQGRLGAERVQLVWKAVRQAAWLPVALSSGLAAAIDYIAPADINVAIFYGVSALLCTRLSSPRHLWVWILVLSVLVFPGAMVGTPPVDPDTPSWVLFTNRAFVSGTLLCMGVIGQGLMQARASREAALRASEMAQRAAEEASQAKSQFLAAASHDLRQPFQAIRLLFDTLRPGLAAGQQPVADRLDEAMRSGENLLNALLDLSALEAGVVVPRPEVFAIDEVLAPLAAEFELQAEKTAIVLRYVPCRRQVEADRAMLARTIRNLLANAVRYTPRGRILMGCRPSGGWLRVEIWDTGIGIAAEHLDRIWSDFYQVGNAARNSDLGLGLGLSIVARTVRLLGHRTGVVSRPGKGSMFFIGVPLTGEPRGVAACAAIDAA